MSDTKKPKKPSRAIDVFVSKWLREGQDKDVGNYLFREDRLYHYGYHYLLAKKNGGAYVLVNDFNYSPSTNKARQMVHGVVHKMGRITIWFKGEPTLEGALACASPCRLGTSCLSPYTSSFAETASEVLALRDDAYQKGVQSILEDNSSLDKFLQYETGKGLLEYLQENPGVSPKLEDTLKVLSDPTFKGTTEPGIALAFVLGRVDKVPGRRPDKKFWKFLKDVSTYGIGVAALNLAPFDGGRLLDTLNNKEVAL